MVSCFILSAQCPKYELLERKVGFILPCFREVLKIYRSKISWLLFCFQFNWRLGKDFKINVKRSTNRKVFNRSFEVEFFCDSSLRSLYRLILFACIGQFFTDYSCFRVVN